MSGSNGNPVRVLPLAIGNGIGPFPKAKGIAGKDSGNLCEKPETVWSPKGLQGIGKGRDPG